MKNNYKIKIIALLLTSIFLLGACTSAKPKEMIEEDQIEGNVISETDTEILAEEEIAEPFATDDIEESATRDNPSEITDTINQTNAESGYLMNGLTEDEIAGLVFMREEEKLAQDVYLGMYEMWGLNIFQNIANSEQTHTDAVKNLLDRFGIEDPADTFPTGVFTNEDLQKLYDDLIVIGTQSLRDALKVGAAIEEIDILDLQEYLETTQNDEIRKVYQNLLRGSENHLRAFTSTLERQTGESYQPQYMSQADYDAIVTSSSSRGGQVNSN